MKATHQPPTLDTEDGRPSPAEILRAAAAYLARHGWVQGDMFDDPHTATPAACAYGAIKMATCGGSQTGYTDEQATDCGRALGVLAGHIDVCFHVWGIDEHGQPGDSYQVVADWNDDQDRTAEHVIAALTEAADEYDRHHTPTVAGGGC
jgi:hypothetical protein